MFKLIKVIFIASFIFAGFSNIFAASAFSPEVVINKIQLGDLNSASNEYVEIYNNSSFEVDVTDWCLYYASAANSLIGSKMTCVTVDNPNIHVFLPGHKSIFAISNQLYDSSGIASDIRFSATLSGTAGHIRLVDNQGVEIDKVTWGNSAVSPEGSRPAVVPISGTILTRKNLLDNFVQDTNINYDDFEITISSNLHSYGAIYEVQDLCSNIDDIQSILPDGHSVDGYSNCSPPPVDMCGNIDGLQIEIPQGFGIDVGNNCVVDTCNNIDGLQSAIPEGMESDGIYGCILRDLCVNLDDIQSEIPIGYKINAESICKLDLHKLEISELLPNPIGADGGNEFIEIYNPNNYDIELTNYRLVVGSNARLYSFPLGSVILANSYKSFSNNEIKFTLVNTSSVVKVISADDELIDETDVYENPGEGVSWNLIDGLWQYSNRPTPGSANLSSFIEEEILTSIDSALSPCAANQYRSPETNRCRLIPVANSVLTPCSEGQYRSETTNRCRNIVSDVASLTQCAEGQERNPATNRCRSIVGLVLGTSSLAPCKEGQERNPETNRCRNVVGDIVQADYAPEQVSQSENNNVIIFSFVGVGVLALGYGIWEWRTEIIKFSQKLKEKFRK